MDPANVGEVLQLPDAVVTAAESGLFPESLARQVSRAADDIAS